MKDEEGARYMEARRERIVLRTDTAPYRGSAINTGTCISRTPSTASSIKTEEVDQRT